MTTTRAGAVLRHFRDIVALEHVGRLPDGELLARFAARREEAAFEALVKRHGPLVLGVCRRLLRDGHDAEDAFQATFLVLARKAGTVGRGGAVGAWLHQVAYRVALRARARAASRRRHERQAGAERAIDPLAEVTGRELLAALDEEMQRLPEKYRAPLVLCHLEGRTCDEAARHLGVALRTLQRRLEQGRGRLRARLERRGLGLSAVLLAVGATAAVPAALAAAAVKAAPLTAGGGVVSPGVEALAEEGLRAVGASKLRRAVLALLAAGMLALGGSALTRQAPAQPPVAGTDDEPSASPAAATEETEPAAKPQAGAMTVSGRVLDPEGKPLEGAQVAVCARQGLVLSSGEWWAAFRNEVLGSVKTDKDGRYRLTVPRADADMMFRTVRVVATAAGHGLAWKALDPDADPTEADLRLGPVQRVSGHLVGLQGEDAAGVTIHVARITRPPQKGEREDDAAFRPPDGLPLSATTDDKGNFVFRGFGPGLRLELEILDPRYERKEDWVIDTADKKQCEDIRLLLAPGRYIEGRCVYQDTGKPVPYAKLMIVNPIIETNADADGRFKVPLYAPRDDDAFAFRPRDVSISAWPPPGEPYLGDAKGVDFPKGVVKREVLLSFGRAALIRGKVTEAGSGKPVAGARVAYNAGYDHSVASGADGSYQIAAAPGPGRLIVTHPSGEYIPQIVGSAGGTPDKPVGDPAYHHAVIDVDVKKDEKVKEVNVTLRRGVTVKGRLVGPDDKPVPSAVMFVSSHRPRFENTMHPVLIRGGRFEVRGLDPEKTYRLLFLEHPRLPPAMVTPESLQGFPQLYMKELLGPQNKLGMSVEVSPKEVKEELTVKLAACGKAKIRFVDGAGKPLANYSPWLQLVVTPGPRIYQALEDKTLAAEVVTLTGRYGGQLANNPTDAQGYVTFEGLIPGATYRLKKTDQEPNNEVLKDFTVEAGKTAELEVVVK
jgi:RNA polymerase sigma factor (sigma-70 family)